MHVTRDVVLDATLDEAWELLTDPDELATWLGSRVGDDLVEADGTVRHLYVDEVVYGQRIGFVWWADDEPALVSRVEFVLTEVEGATRLTVTETARASVASRVRGEALRGAGGIRRLHVGAGWDGRLLDLELRCLTRQHVLV